MHGCFLWLYFFTNDDAASGIQQEAENRHQTGTFEQINTFPFHCCSIRFFFWLTQFHPEPSQSSNWIKRPKTILHFFYSTENKHIIKIPFNYRMCMDIPQTTEISFALTLQFVFNKQIHSLQIKIGLYGSLFKSSTANHIALKQIWNNMGFVFCQLTKFNYQTLFFKCEGFRSSWH